MKKFVLKSSFGGYQAKKDVTNIYPPNVSSIVCVPGSQNVLINDGEKISSRKGYTLDGEASAALTPIISSFEWTTSGATEIPLRSYYDTLQYRSAAGTWNTLATGFGDAVDFKFTTWWDANEVKDLLLFVNGDDKVRSWSGAQTTLASVTGNTLTKQGTETWAEKRFLIAGTRTVIIEGITYTYTGGEGTLTLNGVTPDPTLGSHTAGDTVVQGIGSESSIPYANATNDLIEMHKNQVYIASLDRRDVYISKNTDYTDFTSSPGRLPGEGAILTLDNAVVGFVPQEDFMYISAGKSDWYQTVFTLSSDNTKEALTIEKLKNGPQQAAYSQDLIGKIKNSVVHVSNEPTFDILGRVENINTPQAKPISDMIKDDFGEYDFTGGHYKFHRNISYIALRAESKLLMFDHEREYWQPPQVLPAGRLAIIGGELYLHSNAVPETYKLFDGYSDNEKPINSIAKLGYENYDARAWKKNFDEWFTEGYISSDTQLKVTLNYDYNGFTSIRQKTIVGNDPDVIFETSEGASFGKMPLGQNPLGGLVDVPNFNSRFRVIHTHKKTDFYEMQPVYSSYGENQSWEILACGGNVTLSTIDNISIKK